MGICVGVWDCVCVRTHVDHVSSVLHQKVWMLGGGHHSFTVHTQTHTGWFHLIPRSIRRYPDAALSHTSTLPQQHRKASYCSYEVKCLGTQTQIVLHINMWFLNLLFYYTTAMASLRLLWFCFIMEFTWAQLSTNSCQVLIHYLKCYDVKIMIKIMILHTPNIQNGLL